MENLAITNVRESNTNNTTYTILEILAGTKKIEIMLVSGRSNYINVNSFSASAKAYGRGRSMGKDFTNLEEALLNYKDKKIVSAIKAAKEYIYFSNNPATAVN